MLERNGRHEETRTPDLYRVNELTACIYNNFHGAGRKAKSLEMLLRRDKTSPNVRGLCMSKHQSETHWPPSLLAIPTKILISCFPAPFLDPIPDFRAVQPLTAFASARSSAASILGGLLFGRPQSAAMSECRRESACGAARRGFGWQIRSRFKQLG